MVKTVSTRIKQKTDTASAWATAGTNGFVPLKGEIICYSDSNKMKVGDGETNVSSLEFADARRSSAVYDYNNAANPIYVGYQGSSLTSCTYLAAYGTYNGATCIKNILPSSVTVGAATNATNLKDSSGSYTYTTLKAAIDGKQAAGSYVTTDTEQAVSGKKTFSGGIDVSKSDGFNFSGMQAASVNKERPVWFAYSDGSGNVTNGIPTYSSGFTYNPSANTLYLGTVSASSALYGRSLAITATGTLNNVRVTTTAINIDHYPSGSTTADATAQLDADGVTHNGNLAYWPSAAGTLALTSDVPTNLENGSTAGSAQMKAQPDKLDNNGNFSFGTTSSPKNANAVSLDTTFYTTDSSGNILVPYGATSQSYASAFGGCSSAQGKRSFACGTTTIAKGGYSFACGDNSVALGDDSFVCNYATTAQGVASFAQGVETKVTKTTYAKPSGSSSAGGTGGDAPSVPTTDVNGQGAAAMGVKTQSNGYGSLATGISTISNNTGTFTSGVNTFANGFGAVAVGTSSEADGTDSFAGGTSSWAQNADSFAFGTGAKTNRDGQFAIGKYNALNSGDLFIVGNGSSDSSRNSAFRITSGGVGYLANSGTDSSCVARMADVNSLKTAINTTLSSYLDKRATAGAQTVAAASTFTGGLKSTLAPTENTSVIRKQDIGDQVTFSYSNGTLTITSK